MKLFDDKERINFDFAEYRTGKYEFYDRTAKEQFVLCRNRLNEWFSRYPDIGKSELKNKFMKDNFEAAFFELFIHELFINQGFKLTIHPNVPYSSYTPDFLAVKNDLEFYIEATVATNKSDAVKVNQNRENEIFDFINKIKSPYWIALEELEFLSKKPAKVSRMKNYFEKMIREHGAAIIQLNNKGGIYSIKKKYWITYQDESVKISISLSPSKEKLQRPLGVRMPTLDLSSSVEAIRKAVKEKAQRYGKLEKPYLLCINNLNEIPISTDEVYDSLFGREELCWSEDPNIPNEYLKRGNDGMLSKPITKRVSGIFISEVYVGNVEVAKHWLIQHPHSVNKLDLNCLELSYLHIDEGILKEASGKSIKSIILN